MDWTPHARALADQITHPGSRWYGPVCQVPRHLLVPRWWVPGPDGKVVQNGPADEAAWMRAAYSDRTLVTRIGGLHADHATPGDRPRGWPTSSSTMPSLVLRMFGHARIHPGLNVLDVGTGTGYGTALLCSLLGDAHVTSVDVDNYLTTVATERIAEIGYKPRILTVDATGPLPGMFDRIVATVSVKPIPAGWLAALKPGGRLVTTLTHMSVIVVADKTDDGGAVGHTARDWAMFMRTRDGADYPPGLDALMEYARTAEGEQVTMTRYPVLDIQEEAWELRSMLEITCPGIEHDYHEDNGTRTAIMVHADGSWARAVQAEHTRPIVHQGGPRRLWDEFDALRDYWLQHGSLPLYGATVRITPDGEIHLRRGRWSATIGA